MDMGHLLWMRTATSHSIVRGLLDAEVRACACVLAHTLLLLGPDLRIEIRGGGCGARPLHRAAEFRRREPETAFQGLA